MNVERMRPSEWRRVRAIRLRALADTPDAFGSTLNDELNIPDERWSSRLAAPDAATFIAVRDDHDVGLVVGAPIDGDAGLFSMWVAPEARGEGVGDALVRAVIGWATDRGHERIVLGVGDFNQSAIDLYKRSGFEPTGRRGTLPPPRTHITEHQLALRLK
jgi:ribosomal protein S18 acetylase RimI-like enzyme